MTDLLEFYQKCGIYFPPKILDFYKFLVQRNIDEPVYLKLGDTFKSGHVILNYYSQIVKEKSYPPKEAVNDFNGILDYIGNNNIRFWESETSLWKTQPVLQKGTFSNPPLIFSMSWYIEHEQPSETILVDKEDCFYHAITDKDDEDPIIKFPFSIELLKQKITNHKPFTEKGKVSNTKYLIEMNQTLESIIKKGFIYSSVPDSFFSIEDYTELIFKLLSMAEVSGLTIKQSENVSTYSFNITTDTSQTTFDLSRTGKYIDIDKLVFQLNHTLDKIGYSKKIFYVIPNRDLCVVLINEKETEKLKENMIL